MLNHAHREVSRFVDSAESSYERVRAMYRALSSDALAGSPIDVTKLSEREEALFGKWRSRLGTDADNFVKDGLVGRGGEWSRQTPRVLFLAKDPHDRNNVMMRCGHDLRVLLRDSDDYPENDKTLEKHCGAWAHAIHYW